MQTLHQTPRDKLSPTDPTWPPCQVGHPSRGEVGTTSTQSEDGPRRSSVSHGRRDSISATTWPQYSMKTFNPVLLPLYHYCCHSKSLYVHYSSFCCWWRKTLRKTTSHHEYPLNLSLKFESLSNIPIAPRLWRCISTSRLVFLLWMDSELSLPSPLLLALFNSFVYRAYLTYLSS